MSSMYDEPGTGRWAPGTLVPEYRTGDEAARVVRTSVVVGTGLAAHFHGRPGEPTVTLARYADGELQEAVSMTAAEWEALVQQGKWLRARAELAD